METPGSACAWQSASANAPPTADAANQRTIEDSLMTSTGGNFSDRIAQEA